jgi:hypothetical protein
MEPIDLGTIDVVLYQADGLWIAQGIQFDITARGANPTEASERFTWKIGAELVMSIEIGDVKPLAGVPAAPERFWQMYRDAKMQVVDDQIPLRVVDDSPPLSVIRPRIRISSELVAA